jgi:hypothetical protein
VKAAARALAENPEWSSKSRDWLAVALWAFRYNDHVPDRNTIARALAPEAYKEKVQAKPERAS